MLKEGDEMAFGALYDRYWADIYRNAMKILRSESDAEDVVQELFESVWKRRAELLIHGSVAGYLHTSARYLAIHHIEKKIELLDNDDSLTLAFQQADLPLIESHLDAKILEIAIDKIVETMPEKMKMVFLLSRKEQLTHKQIAIKLHISEETVKKQVYNALKLIRKNMNTIPLALIIATVYAFPHQG
ncbi:sigma-70 family RNA polymerase sigma factor [Chitinophaga flava]|uniref:sigma-70 family RNA polymerase sigma factor n=1 Tax=Chitinophaga flava TaxID=2259036 RepID=UPI0011BD57D3|nr:sigma-70 family RNA polymerase sigma factor [Chitinophaga flava]